MVIGIDCSRALSEGRTGTENYSYYLIRELLRLPAVKKHRFVLYIRPKVQVPSWMRGKGVEIRRIKMKYLWTQVGLARETWGDKLDVLLIPAHTLPLLRRPGIRTVVTIHGLEYKWLPEYKNLLQRWYLPISTFYAARKADKLIAVSQFTRLQLIDELGVDEKKIEVIYEGVQGRTGKEAVNSLGEVLRKYGLLEKKYLFFVGTLQPRKNLSALIRTFSLVSEKYPEMKLVLAGGSGWLVKEIYQAANQSKVVERIVFTGRVSDEELDQLYRGAKLYLQPSIQEGFGLPVLEAMRRGVPVIASDGGALPEIVGGAGVVVRLGKGFEERLASAIDERWRDTSLQTIMIEAGKKRASEYSWKVTAQKTFKVLTESYH
ncbi:MAG: glycosyltransferase family 1 protein [bacterium]